MSATTKSHPIYIADAFTSAPFSGNPAAILSLLETNTKLSDATLQKIASEMNLSETAILEKQASDESTTGTEIPKFSLRWFSPTNEVHFCGHATLATSHVVFSKMPQLLNGSDTVQYDTAYGELTVKKTPSGRYQMMFPRGDPQPVGELGKDSSILNRILQMLSLDPSKHPIRDVRLCRKTKKLMICFQNLNSVLEADPHVSQLLQYDFEGNETLNQYVKGIIVNTQFDKKHQQLLSLDHDQFDFVTRYFTPWNGIPEDPVNGSGHTVQAVYWSQQLGKTTLQSFQASKRRGELYMELCEDGKNMYLCGFAVNVMEGKIDVPEEGE